MRNKKAFKRSLAILSLLAVLLACLVPSDASSALVREPRLNLKYLSAVRGTSYRLNVYNMQRDYTAAFSSSNTSVVAIRKAKARSCRLRTKSSGSAAVTVKITDGDDNLIATLTCKVTVSPSAVSIKFAKHKVKLTKGCTRTIKAITKPNISAEQPRYISDDPDISTVSSTGMVTAVSEGQTTIHAYISNKKEAFYTITVKAGDEEEDDSYEPEPEPSPSPAVYYNLKGINSSNEPADDTY